MPKQHRDRGREVELREGHTLSVDEEIQSRSKVLESGAGSIFVEVYRQMQTKRISKPGAYMKTIYGRGLIESLNQDTPRPRSQEEVWMPDQNPDPPRKKTTEWQKKRKLEIEIVTTVVGIQESKFVRPQDEPPGTIDLDPDKVTVIIESLDDGILRDVGLNKISTDPLAIKVLAKKWKVRKEKIREKEEEIEAIIRQRLSS